jgi:hypothetical protein
MLGAIVSKVLVCGLVKVSTCNNTEKLPLYASVLCSTLGDVAQSVGTKNGPTCAQFSKPALGITWLKHGMLAPISAMVNNFFISKDVLKLFRRQRKSIHAGQEIN